MDPKRCKAALTLVLKTIFDGATQERLRAAVGRAFEGPLAADETVSVRRLVWKRREVKEAFDYY